MTSARGHDAAVRRAKLRMPVRPEEIEGERTAQAPVIQLSPSRGTDHPGCQVIQPAPLGSRDLCVTSARGHDAAVRRAKLRMSVRPEEIEGERTGQAPGDPTFSIQGNGQPQALRVPSGQAPGDPKVSRQGGTGLVVLPAPTRRFEEQNSECPFALRKSKGNGQDRPQVIQPSPSRGTGSPGPSSSLRTGPRLSEGFTPGGTGLVALPAPTWVI